MDANANEKSDLTELEVYLLQKIEQEINEYDEEEYEMQRKKDDDQFNGN
jgi:hypothetical protein